MEKSLFEQHHETLKGALAAISSRSYWSPYAEMPSPRAYGEDAHEKGKIAYLSHLNKQFDLDQPGLKGWVSEGESPYGETLGISYPVCDHEALIEACEKGVKAWQRLGSSGRTGVCLEILSRLNNQSFELAYSVMMTTGQGWMMAFQAGAPHAQDRGLEAIAYAFKEQSCVPEVAIWEKPQGKNPSLLMKKHYEIVGRGIALVIGCATFPTWNTYPGLFAALVTGNPVIVKPHGNAILPAAITVKTIRGVLEEQGLDPNLVCLCVVDKQETTQQLAKHPKVKSIDFTGGSKFGRWLIDNCQQAQVYAELAGVNNVVIDSTDAYKSMLSNLAFTLSLYSGQMCTTTQVIFVPGSGIETDLGHKSFDDVCADLAAAVEKIISKPEMALSVLGAIQSRDTLTRIEQANASQYGQVLLASKSLSSPEFPQAEIRTPVLIVCDASQEDLYSEERFGPISFIVKTSGTEDSSNLSEKLVNQHGALTVGVYSTSEIVIDQITEATLRSKVALSVNLTGGVYVNQSAAYSDFHATGGNPAANASYSNSAFVSNRFCVVQKRYHA